MKLKRSTLVALALGLLASCGGGSEDDTTEYVVDDSTARGTLVRNPPERTASWSGPHIADLLKALANGDSLLEAAGDPVCGIDFHRIEYQTVGAKDEPARVSGVLMVPTGEASSCSGPRPIVVYAHGTSTERSYNLAAVGDTDNPAWTEGLEVAAIFAAQGYIVVAPNYVGYDTSSLAYHPYLNADQQSKDMIDALSAARKALGKVQASTTVDSGRLFVTGYSQGGHVAMATHRAMQTAGQTVTASAPMSGPYALLAFLDSVVLGNVGLGSTEFMPLLTTSWQRTYGNLYTTPSEFYETQYADGIESLLPNAQSFDDLVSAGKLPASALFSDQTPVTGDASLDAALAKPSDPVFALGFGTPNLVRNSVRVAYGRDALADPDGARTSPQTAGVPMAANPTHPMRVAAKNNDLRNWTPQSPVLLCGGNADPTVPFSTNTLVMQSYWSGLPSGRLTVLDIDTAVAGDSDPYAAPKRGFALVKDVLNRTGGETSVRDNYHVYVAPFCTAAARDFFDMQAQP